MKFTKIRLTGLSVCELPIVGALPSDQYILKAADGLGPTEVDVSIAGTLNAGGVYQGRRPQNREIVLRVGLNPEYAIGQTAADLRSSLYGMLTPGSSDIVLVEIINDEDVVATTNGYVKKLEIAPFSKDPEVQITIASTSAYLEGPNRLFINPGDKANPVINNVGTAPSGFFMAVKFTAPVSNWVLTDATGKKLEVTYDFIVNDILSFDTHPGSRMIQVTRDLIPANIFYALSSDSMWLALYGGVNVFDTNSQDFDWGDVYYHPQYWGI